MDHHRLTPPSGQRHLRLWLVRHARPLVPEGVCYGASDVPACSADTAAAAQRLSLQLPRHAQLQVSGLGRAQQLATALRALRADLGPARINAGLNEMDFGNWELQPWDVIERTQLDAWAADFAHYRPGGRESVAQLLARVQRCLRALFDSTPCRGANDARSASGQGVNGGPRDVIWITHAGVIRAVQYLNAEKVDLNPAASQWPQHAPAFGGVVPVDLRPIG